jgi:uncharacterized protein YbjT (DUF2867 family)
VILVTGATGNVGNALVHALAAGDEAVRALARNPDRARFPSTVDVVSADLETPESVIPALVGIRKVFLLGGFVTTDLVRRVRESAVDHIALLTSRCVVGGNPDNAITRMWLDAEAAVRDSGVAWTILRPSGFHSNALRWRPQLQAGDVLRAPWPAVRIASIDPADIAAVAAAVLTRPGYEGTAPALSGPQPLTPSEQVGTLARVLGRPLRYEPMTDEEARSQMEADTPASIIDAFFRFFSGGEFDDAGVVDSVQEMTGQHPRTFEQWAHDHAHAFRNGV